MSNVGVAELLSPQAPHEQVVFCQDSASGLRAIIALHSTALGPGLGGTRFFPYPTLEAALRDVLALSRAMTYKNALAGLDHGGGKAVIIGDPTTEKSEALLRAYGRFVESLGGRYVTAADVGTSCADLDLVARETRFATGGSGELGGAGDSSVLTAWGVYQGMRACAAHLWGSADLGGRRVGIAGVGKVGRHLAEHLAADGAELLVTDVNPAALAALQADHPGAKVVADTDTLIRADLDIYAPCALGGALDHASVTALSAQIVCGGANDQLAQPDIDDLLTQRGVLYAPDFLVNAGGVIQVADEFAGRHAARSSRPSAAGVGAFSFERAKARASGIYATTTRVLQVARDQGISPAAAADRLAEERVRDLPRRSAIHLPHP